MIEQRLEWGISLFVTVLVALTFWQLKRVVNTIRKGQTIQGKGERDSLRAVEEAIITFAGLYVCLTDTFELRLYV